VVIKKTKELKIFNFMSKGYHINEQFERIKREKTKKIFVKGYTIVKMLFLGIFIREKSFNQLLEKIHKRKKYRSVFNKNEHIPKMHAFREGIKELNVKYLEEINRNIIKQARENKIYRKGSIDNLVVVGIDGVETFGSYKKDWNNSYKKKIKIQEYKNGKKEKIEKEYHEQINIFAKIVGMRPGLVLGYETVTCNGLKGKQEYEPDVAIKLIKTLKESYGRGIDIIVGDAIYLEEKFLKEVKNEGYHCVVRLKDNRKNLINEVEGLYKLQNAEILKIKNNKEIKCWSEIINYKDMKLKAVKFKEKYKKGKEIKEDTIYVVSTDLMLANDTINKIIHERWDIENEGFNELKNHCHMKHCYMADEKAIHVILQMMIICYNLWELYIYGHLHDFEKMQITKLGYIEEIAEAINEATYKELIFFSSA
jgi:hypothetical protein